MIVVMIQIIMNHINDDDLRKLFCDRNPGDARVKVGSERKVAMSPNRGEFRPRRDRGK